MKVRFFVTGTAALLAVWLVATFVNQVPVDRYPQFGRGSVPVSAKAVKPKEQAKPAPEFEDKILELTDTVTQLHEENTLLKDKIALGQWDATEIEKIDAEELIADLRNQIKLLEMENKSLRDSRDMYQNRNSELMRTVKALTAKLKKAGIE